MKFYLFFAIVAHDTHFFVMLNLIFKNLFIPFSKKKTTMSVFQLLVAMLDCFSLTLQEKRKGVKTPRVSSTNGCTSFFKKRVGVHSLNDGMSGRGMHTNFPGVCLLLA